MGICGSFRIVAVGLAFTIAAQPCSMVVVSSAIWSKKPGNESKRFAFEKDGKVGFIDELGNIVIEPKFDRQIDAIDDFSDGLIRIDQTYFDEFGNQILSADGQFFAGEFSEGLVPIPRYVSGEGYTTFFTTKAGAVTFSVPGNQRTKFHEGLASIEAKEPPKEAMYPGSAQSGFINLDGEVVIEPQFASVGDFHDGRQRPAGPRHPGWVLLHH